MKQPRALPSGRSWRARVSSMTMTFSAFGALSRRSKRPPLQQGNSQGREIVPADIERRGPSAATCFLDPSSACSGSIFVDGEMPHAGDGKGGRHPQCRHAREGSQMVCQGLAHLGAADGVIARGPRIDLDDQLVIQRKAGVGPRQSQNIAGQQRRRYHEDNGQRRSDRATRDWPGARRTMPSTAPPDSFISPPDRARDKPQRRPQAEQQRGDQAEAQRGRQNANVQTACCTPFSSGSCGAASQTLRTRVPQKARRTPRAPPSSASSRDSMSNCPTIRPRPPPRANRTAISRWRRGPLHDQHVRQVQAGDDQDHRGHGHQDQTEDGAHQAFILASGSARTGPAG